MKNFIKFWDAKAFVHVFLSVLIIFIVCAKIMPIAGYKITVKKLKPRYNKITLTDDERYQNIANDVSALAEENTKEARKYRKKKNSEKEYKTMIND